MAYTYELAIADLAEPAGGYICSAGNAPLCRLMLH